MNHVTDNMIPSEKRSFYVKRLANLDSQRYKLAVGLFVSGGLMVANFFTNQLREINTMLPIINAAIGVYCGLSMFANMRMTSNAVQKLDPNPNNPKSIAWEEEVDKAIDAEFDRIAGKGEEESGKGAKG